MTYTHHRFNRYVWTSPKQDYIPPFFKLDALRTPGVLVRETDQKPPVP